MIKVRLIERENKINSFEKRVERAATQGVDEAADMFISNVRDHWSTGTSSPGEAPGVKTGNLDQSLFKENQGRDVLGRFAGNKGPVRFVRVDTTKGPKSGGRSEYGGTLEDEMDRPFIEPAAERMSKQLGIVIRRKL